MLTGKMTRGEWGMLIVCTALTVLIFATGALKSRKVWPDLSLDGLEGGVSLSLEAGDAYGVIGGGPYYDLPAGTYRIKWRLYGDGENIIRIACSNGAGILPSEIRTTPGEWEEEAWFELTEAAHNVSIRIEFASGTRMEFVSLRLYSPVYTDGAWAAAFVLLGGWLLWVIWRHTPDEAGRRAILLLGLAVAIASVQALREDALLADDTQFHAARIMNLADGLRGGQFPVRLGGFSYNGYGAVTSVFYPDMLLMPLALMVLAGASITFVLQVFTVAMNVLTAAIMYGAARRLFDRQAALFAAILYVLSVYRLERSVESFMAGQTLAMAFLPLFLLGLWEVCFGERGRWPLLALGATLVLQSHLLTTLLCAALAVCVGLALLPKLLRERRLSDVFKAIAATALLNAFALVRMAMYYLGGVNTPTMQFGFTDSALALYELFMPGSAVGLPLLLGAAALLWQTPMREDREKMRLARFCAAAGALAMLMSTRVFPWRYVVELTGGLIEVLQFPWRLLMFTAVFFALCGGYGFARALRGNEARAALIVLAISVLCAGPILRQTMEEGAVLEFGQGVNPYMVYPEYQIEGTDVEATRQTDVLTDGDVVLTAYEKRSTTVTAQVDARTDASVTLPLFGFDGYRVQVDGREVAWRLGENNRLTVDLPAGTSGALRVWFAGKAAWRAADIVSLLTLLALLARPILRMRGRMKERPEPHNGR